MAQCFVGHAPEFFGRIPKPSGENGQNDSKCGGDKPLVFVRAVSEPNQGRDNRSAEGGTFFIGFLGACFIAGCIGYWMAGKQR